jgi:SAM-dependent methyltransferase
MSDWTSGYVSEIDYLYGCYSELNPLRASLAFLNVGLRHPSFATACELGFGQGVSVTMHAAASLTTWHGTDFNPVHAASAQALARISGAAADLREEGFEQFCTRDDLPDFDFVGLHGVWSWISDENRRLIVDFLGRKLKVGGVLYISYNCLPGWAAMVPFRHLMSEHASLMSRPGEPITTRVSAAMTFMDGLLAAGSSFAEAQPGPVARLKRMNEQSRSYLAHEYFNRDWDPVHFAEMADWLAPAKLAYACSASPLEHIDFLNLTTAQRTFLKEIPNPRFRESTRDILVNQQFRRDYWVKGAKRLARPAQMEAVRNLRMVLTTPRAEIALTARGAIGETKLDAETYEPVLRVLEDYRIRSLAEIEAETKKDSIAFGQLVQVAIVLIGKGVACLAQEDAVIDRAKQQTDRLNAHLMDQARTSWDIGYLASPVTGGAVAVGRVEQLFLLARTLGLPASGWGSFVADLFDRQEEKLQKGGESLDTVALSRELDERAEKFAASGLAILKALMIA